MASPTASATAQLRGAHVSEQEARAVAEASRETEWEKPSFVRELFDGRLDLSLIHPFPTPDPDEQKRAAEWMARFEAFLRERVDGERIEREARIPEDVIQGLRDLGAFGIKIPREYGGLGFSQRTYGHAVALAGSESSALVTLLSAHQSIGVPQPVKLFGTEAQKKEFLTRCARGAISAFALTEGDVGSDPARMTTLATPLEDGSGWSLSGEKLWCTNGSIAELLVVMARTPGKGGKPGPISAFIVEAKSPGVHVTHRLDFMGLKGIENAVIRFEDVKVPRANLLWEEGKGLKLALVTLNTGRLTLPASCAAAGKWCLNVVRHWGNDRVQWGKPIGRHDSVAQMTADIAAKTFAMEAIAELGAMLADRHTSDIRLEAALAKMWNSDTAWEIADKTLAIRGGRGYETAASLASRGETPIPLERLVRDLRINRIFEGSNEILHLFVAREAVDTHLKVAGDLIDPKAPAGKKLAAMVKAGLFYARWYPAKWLGWGAWPQYGEFGRLAGHLRFVDRTSRRLARAQFHAMMRYQGGLERRQMVLFRFVDVAAELYAMSAAVVLAHAMKIEDGADSTPVELADHFCRGARRRIAASFRAVGDNDDVAGYRLARRVFDGDIPWLEEGVFNVDDLLAQAAAAEAAEAAQVARERKSAS
jgi:alkylation response protein AidB-like acyl-CoA dehydrogenase